MTSVVRVPALVKGELVFPPKVSLESLRRAFAGGGDPAPRRLTLDGAHVLRRPVLDRSTLAPTGEDQFHVLPRVDPRALVETDATALLDLYDLPLREVADYVGALREAVAEGGLGARVAGHARTTSRLDDRRLRVLFEILPALLDPDALVDSVEHELGGVDYLDGWVRVPANARRGPTARAAERLFGPWPAAADGPLLRAMPTRQLHVTSGNSDVIPFVSALRAFATKGAAVIKSPAESTAAATLLSVAMHALDPSHPLTRHTSILYWPGGERATEDVLLARGSFDRIVVWGSAETVRSIAARAPFTKTVFLSPSVGLSLVGREAFDGRLRDAAVRGASDSVVGDQLACTASLVHYVEATEDDALEYCRVLRDLLGEWDRALPHALSEENVAGLRRLRRGAFVAGRWFENGRWPDTTSVVVYMPTEFDLAVHPTSRCVVVRNVDDLRDALRFVHAGISTAGVYPEERRAALRDELAARGVSNVFPLGDAERVYAGMPHDGMRVLSELVHWTNG